jgi:hypothetical protein
MLLGLNLEIITISCLYTIISSFILGQLSRVAIQLVLPFLGFFVMHFALCCPEHCPKYIKNDFAPILRLGPRICCL